MFSLGCFFGLISEYFSHVFRVELIIFRAVKWILKTEQKPKIFSIIIHHTMFNSATKRAKNRTVDACICFEARK